MKQAHPITGVVDLDAHGTDRHFAQTLGRGLEVLRAFRSEDPFLTNREICKRTGFPKATVSRLTYTLMLLGYLVQAQDRPGFRLGASVLSIGHPLLAQMKVRQIIRPYMEKLAKVARCTVNLGIRDRLDVIYVDSCRSDEVNREVPDIGSTRPLMCTAIGRALILSMNDKERTAILNRLRLDDAGRFSRAEVWLTEDATRLKRDGFCLSRGDWVAQIFAAAVPISGGPDGVPLALNCTTFMENIQEQRIEREIAPMLVQTCRAISDRLSA